MTPENKEIVREWIAALRSGKYIQGKTQLRLKSRSGGQDKFCCLGVACDIVDPDKWTKNPVGAIVDYNWIDGGGYLPKAHPLSIDLVFDDTTKLVNMNDRENKSFLEIADYLEATYL